MLAAIQLEGEIQGVMALSRLPQPSRFGQDPVVYVDYVESAPWNLKSTSGSPRFIGVGTLLIAEAVRISYAEGLGGRIGLHSLPQAEAFYTRCQMSRFGPDPGYYDLSYFEFSEQRAINWLASIGESL